MGDKLSVVTGATGHVGYALVKELEARGENFRILIRKDSKIFDGINEEDIVTVVKTRYHGTDSSITEVAITLRSLA